MKRITRYHIDHNGSIRTTIDAPTILLKLDQLNAEQLDQIKLNLCSAPSASSIPSPQKEEKETKEEMSIPIWIPFFHSKKFETIDSQTIFDPSQHMLKLSCNLAGYPNFPLGSRASSESPNFPSANKLDEKINLYIFGKEAVGYSISYPQKIQVYVSYEDGDIVKKQTMECTLTKDEDQFYVFLFSNSILDIPIPLTISFNGKI